MIINGQKKHYNNKINTIISNRFKVRHIIVFILLCIFICLNSTLSTSYADEKSKNKSQSNRYINLDKENIIKGKIDNLEVNISCSLNGNVKMYAFTQIKVELKNSGEFFAGIMQVGIPQSEEGILYTKNFEVSASGTKTMSMYLPVNIQTDSIRFEILDRTGKKLLEQNIKTIVHSQDKILVGILAPDPTAINYIASESNSTYFYFNKDTIPADYRALDAVNILIINRYEISQLSVGQYVAITDWVRNGGTLVFGTGDGAAGFLGTFAGKFGMNIAGVQDIEISFVDKPKTEMEELVRAKLVEDGYSIEEQIWNNFWTAYSAGNYENKSEGIEIGPVSNKKVANMSIISAYLELANKYWLTTKVAEIKVDNGIIIESSASVPILQSLIHGQGKVMVASFDLAAVDASFIGLREQISSSILAYAAVEDKTIFNTFLTSILGSAKGKVPNTIIYIIILGLYVVLTLFTIIVLNLKNKTKKLFAAIPLYTLIVCGLFGIMGMGTRINKLHSSYFNIKELKPEGKAEVEKYFDVTLPENKIYKLRLQEKKDIYNVNITNRNTSLVSSDNDTYNTYVTAGNKGVDVRFDGISTFDTKTFSTSETIDTTDVFEVALNCWENEYGGSIVNKTATDFEYVFIVTKSAVLFAGEMDKGVKVNETKFKRKNYTSYDELEYIIPELMDKKANNNNSLDAKGRITPNGITRTMQYYIMSRGLSGVNKGCIFAVAKNTSDMFVDNKIKEEGINIVTSEFDVNYIAGEQRYIPNVCLSDLTFELGNYNYSTTTGSIYVVNNTIADYRIGDNVTLNSLNFITTSNYQKETSRNFEGKVSFWNYNANKYEEVFDSSKDKKITDFTNYLGGNNTIKMKFEVKSDGIGYNVPMISAVVTQK